MVQVQQAHQRVMVIEAAFQRQLQVADLGPHLPQRQVRQDRGRRSPSISASIIASPDLVAMDDATEPSLIPASWSTLPSR